MKFDKLFESIIENAKDQYFLKNDLAQMEHEVKWISNKMDIVKKEMEKRPSKIKHLNDLKRQLNQKLERIQHIKSQLGI